MHLTDQDKAQFLALFPGMRIAPSRDSSRVYEGEFRFTGSSDKWGLVEDAYQLRIVIAPGPRSLPKVWETTGRIARTNPTHINPAPDGTLCLGSFLRLRFEMGNPPTLVGFSRKCIAPYLYAMSLHEQGKPAFVLGELVHGASGLLQDYEEILGVRGLRAVTQALRLASRRRRVANKLPCPCGCGKRLGGCAAHHRINALRRIVPRTYLASLTDGQSLTSPSGVA